MPRSSRWLRAAVALLVLACGVADAETRNGTLTIATSQPAGTLTVSLTGAVTANVAPPLPTQAQLSTVGGGIGSLSVSGPVACTASRCGIAQAAMLSPAALGAPGVPGYTFPHGIFTGVVAGCTPGTSVQFVYTFPAALPEGTRLFQYGATSSDPSPHWSELAGTISGNTVVVAAVDGGSGDRDLAANGTLAVQIGAAAPVATAPPPPAVIPVDALGGASLVLLATLLAIAAWRALRVSQRGSAALLVAAVAAAAVAWHWPAIMDAVGQGTAALDATPPSLTFAPQDLGSVSAAQRVRIRNQSAGPVTLGSIAVQGSFAHTDDCPRTLAAGEACSIDVRLITSACDAPPPPPPPAPPPVITSTTPGSLPVDGQAHTLTLTGHDFAAGATVSANMTTLTPGSVSATTITITLPGALVGAPGSIALQVRNPDGQTSNTVSVPVVPAGALALDHVTPDELPAYGFGHRVGLSGSGFAPGAVAVIGGMPLTAVQSSASLLVVDVPGSLLSNAATLPVLVRNPDGALSNSLSLAVTLASAQTTTGEDPLAIKITHPDDGTIFAQSLIPVSGTQTGAQRVVVVNACTPAQLGAGTFVAPAVPLAFGDNLITAIAYGKSGATARDSILVHNAVPRIAIASPPEGTDVDDDSVLVGGTYEGPPNSSVTVNGVRARVNGSTFSALVPLTFGTNVLQATVVTADARTNSTQSTVRDTLPVLQITAPALGLELAAESIGVSGTFQGLPGTPITVNDITATISGNQFSVAAVPLRHGRNALTVKAVSPTGRVVMRSVMVKNLQPTLTIDAPLDGATIAAVSVTVKGVVTGKQGPNREPTIVTVNGVTATRSGNRGPWIPDPPFGNPPFGDASRYLIQDYTATVPLHAGANVIEAIATSASGLSISRRITVFRPDVVLAIVQPADGITVYDDSVVVSGRIDGTSGGTVSVNGVAGFVAANQFTARVPLGLGSNALTVQATTSSGPASQVLHVTRADVGVAITDPLEGASLSETSTLVRGTFAGPPDSSVAINGVPAAVSGSTFVAANVTVAHAATSLTAVLSTPDGRSATHTIHVTGVATAPPLVEVLAEPSDVIAPRSVRFMILNNSGSPVTRVEVDTRGSGFFDVVRNGPVSVLSVPYTDSGVFVPRVRVTNAAGATFNATQVVRVRTLAEMDAMLRAIYGRMIARLSARDVNGALASVSAGVYAKYQSIFTDVAPRFPGILDSVGELRGGTIGEGYAEYVLVRTTSTGRQGFFIYFIRGEDGLWRIEGM